MSTKTIASSFGNLTDKEIEKIKNSLKECSTVFTLMEAQRDTLKNIINDLHEEVKIPKKIIRMLAQTYHKQNFSEVVAEQEEFELIFDGVVNN